MKINAEKFLNNLEQYKFEQTVFFVTGNEEGLINKVQNIILSKQKSIISNELNSFIESGGKVHVRSIFVQGLILMKLEKIPKHLKDLVKPIKIFQNIALEAEVDPISLAIQSVYKLCPKCKLVLGANSSKQLKETLNKSKVYVNNAVIEEVLKISKKFSGKRWDPRFWIK